MGNYTIFWMFENPRRGRQARNFTTNIPKILDLKSFSEQIFSDNERWVPPFIIFYNNGVSWAPSWAFLARFPVSVGLRPTSKIPAAREKKPVVARVTTQHQQNIQAKKVYSLKQLVANLSW